MGEEWETISVRGTGFAPTKEKTLVDPPNTKAVEQEQSNLDFPKRVGSVSMKTSIRVDAQPKE